MANSITRINSSNENKIYNIEQYGSLPIVVFGRTIKPNSVPGTQYYFRDGIVKVNNDMICGFEPIFIYGGNINEWDGGTRIPSGQSCIFTVPDNFDFNKIHDHEYIASCCRSAQHLNANTVSPNYIIRNGEYICIKAFDIRKNGNKNENIFIKGDNLRYKIAIMKRPSKRGGYNIREYNNSLRFPKKIRYIKSSTNTLSASYFHKNAITIVPVGRRKKNCKSIYKYKIFKQVVFRINENNELEKRWIVCCI